MGNFHAILSVMHEQHLQILGRVHDELVEAVRDAVLGSLVRSITNVWHQSRALELTTDTAINTPGLAPAWLHSQLAVLTASLEALKALRALLHNLPLVTAGGHLGIPVMD